MGVSSPSYFINHIIKNKKNMKNLIIVPFDLNTARKIKHRGNSRSYCDRERTK